MVVKHCAGAVLYDDLGRIFLMQSHKFRDPLTKAFYWILYGGKIEADESEEATLHREAGEELGVGIADFVKIDGNFYYDPQGKFYKPDITFLFETYAGRMLSTDITPNEEVTRYDFFYRKQTESLLLLPSTEKYLGVFYNDQRFTGLWK